MSSEPPSDGPREEPFEITGDFTNKAGEVQTSVQAKIEEGMADCRAGRTVPDDQAWAELKAWRDEQMKQLGS